MKLLITHNETVVAAHASINTVGYVRNLIKNKDGVFLRKFSLEKDLHCTLTGKRPANNDLI